MRIGFSLRNNQGIEDVQALVDLAVQAEALGFDSVWAHDHVFNVGHVRERIGSRPYYEPLTLLSYVAARTSRVRLGTSVLVLPYHNPSAGQGGRHTRRAERRAAAPGRRRRGDRAGIAGDGHALQGARSVQR